MDFLRGRTWPLWTRSLLVVKILLGSVQGAGCRAAEFEDKKRKRLCTLSFCCKTGVKNDRKDWSKELGVPLPDGDPDGDQKGLTGDECDDEN